VDIYSTVALLLYFVISYLELVISSTEELQWLLFDFIPLNNFAGVLNLQFAKQTRKQLLSTLLYKNGGKIAIERPLFSWADHFAEAYPRAEREGGGENYKYYCSLLVGYNDSAFFLYKKRIIMKTFFSSFKRVLL
jgi:hypothetical protein